MLGIWKDIEDLESSLSIPELFYFLEAYHKRIYDDRKFFAAIQGIDLDKENKKTPENTKYLDKLRERMSKKAGRPIAENDITLLRGRRAKEKGFGIGMGIEYEVVDADGNARPG